MATSQKDQGQDYALPRGLGGLIADWLQLSQRHKAQGSHSRQRRRSVRHPNAPWLENNRSCWPKRWHLLCN